MKFLAGFHTRDEAEALRTALEARGIAVQVQERGWRDRGTQFHYHVFAALELQYADAAALMANPGHVVVHPVDVTQYQAYMASAHRATRARIALLRGLALLLLAALGFAGGVMMLIAR